MGRDVNADPRITIAVSGACAERSARFEKLAGDFKQKIQYAPTPALRRMYQRQLNDLAKAKDTLLRG